MSWLKLNLTSWAEAWPSAPPLPRNQTMSSLLTFFYFNAGVNLTTFTWHRRAKLRMNTTFSTHQRDGRPKFRTGDWTHNPCAISHYSTLMRVCFLSPCFMALYAVIWFENIRSLDLIWWIYARASLALPTRYTEFAWAIRRFARWLILWMKYLTYQLQWLSWPTSATCVSLV